jgi:hypothetical protein
LIRFGGGFAITGCEVQVLATARTKSLAVFFAERAGGHDILKRETTFIIITDFGLVWGDGALAGLCIGGLGAKDEVELSADRSGNRLDTSRAEQFKVSMVGSADANVGDVLAVTAVLDDEVGAPDDGQRANLRDVWGVVERAGGDRFVEEERPVFEL